MHFYKDSGLLAKVERRATDPTSGKEFNEERLVLEYRDVDGMKFYKKIQIKRDGEVYLDVENVDAKFPETIDDNEFAKP